MSRYTKKGLAIVPGLLLCGLLLSACEERSGPSTENIALCLAETTPIETVQGDSWRSPLEGTRQTVGGVVTVVDQHVGFYLEQGQRENPQRSGGLFIESPLLSENARPGQLWVLEGTVVERGEQRDTVTTLSDTVLHAVCEEGLPLPSTEVSLPLSGPEREALESMRIRFGAELFVTDVYSQHRGMLTLSTGEPLWVPTEYMDPGSTAAAGFRRNRAHSIEVELPGTPGTPLSVGSEVGNVIGLFGHDGRDPLLRLEQADYQPAPSPAAPAGAPQLRVVNANLLNFFNGDGRGGGFPAERGARSRDEFENQKARLRAALDAMGPDLLAVQELENDGFGPDSAAADLLRLLEAGGRGPYRAVEPSANRVGGDVIAVGLFYREAALEPVGPSSMLAAEPFRDLSRQPLAQVFRHRATGTIFLAASNHLKSKGGCPEPGPNANQGDGQGCWNTARVEAVHALLPWLEEKARAAGTDNILVFGDMNAYRREDPISIFRDAGYLELVETLEELPQYSYRFFGQAGTLDYIFATRGLARAATGAKIWHINADWPARMTLPEPWLRMSDHDPVIVDFEFDAGR